MAKKLRRQPDTVTAAATPSRRKRTTGEIVASARIDSLGEKREATTGASSKPSAEWQKRAWQYYDEVGELHYAASFLGACLSRCVLTVGVPDDEGHVGPAFDDDGKPLEGIQGAVDALQLIRALKSDVGGQSQMLRTMGINMMLAGEMHLIGQPYDDGVTEVATIPVQDLSWEVLSTDEFRPKGQDYERIRSPGVTPVEIKGERVHAIRIWREHPRFSELPDSSVRAVLDILEELVLLTREVRAEALSRLTAAGLLLVPDEISWADDDGDDQGDEGDPFTADLINAMSTAISDKTSAAGTVPFVIRAPWELLDHIQHIDMTPKSSDKSAEKRKEAVQRFAQGVELPVEIVTGHAQTTFSNAVQIDDSLFKSHVEPVLEIICDALTSGYLRPALGDETPFIVHFDSSELVTRPNRAQDAKDLHDRYALSDASLRTANGFSEGDAPEDDELQKRIEIKQLTNMRRTIQDTPADIAAQDKHFGDTGETGPAINVPIPGGNNLDKTLAASVQAAAEVSLARAVTRAGARLRSKANKQPAVRSLLQNVPDAEVAVTLSSAKVQELMGDDDLFHGEFDALWTWVLRHSEGDRAYADSVLDACQQLAPQMLYRPRMQFEIDVTRPCALSNA